MKDSLYSDCCNHILFSQYFSENLCTLDAAKKFSKIFECFICQDSKSNDDLVDRPSNDSFQNLLSRVQERYKYKDKLSSDCIKWTLKVRLWKLYSNEFMIASTQIASTENFAFIAVPVLKLLSSKVLFINRKENRNC